MKLFIVFLIGICLIGCKTKDDNSNKLQLQSLTDSSEEETMFFLQSEPTDSCHIKEESQSNADDFSISDAENLCRAILGTVDEETGFELGYRCIDLVYIDEQWYYIIYRTWIVDGDESKSSHPSFVGYAIVSIDGTHIYDGRIDESGNYSLGRVYGTIGDS